MSTPTEAHRKLVDEIVFLVAHDDHKGEAAQLLADSEARAVEAALHGANVNGLTLCGCKDHPQRKDLSCCKIRRTDGTALTVAETFAALTASRERVRVLEEAEKEANAKLALYRSRVFRAKSILSYIEDDGTEQHHSATPERKEGEQ